MARKYLPENVTVFGAELKVVESLNLFYGDTKVDGLFNAFTKEIYIEKALPKDDKLHTFIHELGHALLWRVGMTQANIPPEIEELIVENNATMITEMFNLTIKKKK